jgi:uncharacterized protein YsxB (DUF464 family)
MNSMYMEMYMSKRSTRMKKLSHTLVLVLLVGAAALAYGKSKPLADKQLDRISAGSAIADGESTATDSRDFQVELSGSSLSGASGVNIVNAANSTVANGVNTWSGDHLANVTFAQTNMITQRDIPCDCEPGEVAALTFTKEEFEADMAIGNAIALDGSTATSKTEESIELDGSAESNAKAVNIVNAAGSLVANGVNVAATSTAGNVTFAQTNVITQSGH